MTKEVLLLGLFVFYLVVINGYFRIAERFNIIDKPNSRSSHTKITLRGGGVLIPIAVLTYGCVDGFLLLPYFIAAVVVVSVISFWDDIQSLPSSLRLLVQFAAMGTLLYQVGLFSAALWLIPIVFIVSIGLINAYNFMDGINGITVLNSFVSVFTLIVLGEGSESRLLWYILPALVVFGIYNVRSKAKCFAGDIGSISIGYIVLYFMLKQFLQELDIQYILVLAVYGVDSILTIIHRLMLRENIFEPHRRHLYQYLVHVGNWGHIRVSVLYAVIQLVVSGVLIWNVKFQVINGGIFTLLVLCSLIVTYVVIKRMLLKKEQKRNAE